MKAIVSNNIIIITNKHRVHKTTIRSDADARQWISMNRQITASMVRIRFWMNRKQLLIKATIVPLHH